MGVWVEVRGGGGGVWEGGGGPLKGRPLKGSSGEICMSVLMQPRLF